jgi:DNA end-binding protein Ku
MAARSSWKGFLKLSLVSVPVKAYPVTTTSGNGDIHLNQLHADCNSRIQHQKVCPLHGQVTQDAIVSAYEYAKGQYVVVDTGELDKLRTPDDKAITIDVFIPADELPSIYLSGKAYYLAPDGPVGQKSYAVLHQTMAEHERQAIAQVVLHGREQLVLVRPFQRLLVMLLLHHDQQVTRPALIEEDLVPVAVSVQERELARTLVEASTAREFALAKYQDVYTEKLTRLIEAKVAGEEIVAPPQEEHAQVINLMDALRQSVARAQKQQRGVNGVAHKVAMTNGKEGRSRKRKSS